MNQRTQLSTKTTDTDFEKDIWMSPRSLTKSHDWNQIIWRKKDLKKNFIGPSKNQKKEKN